MQLLRHGQDKKEKESDGLGKRRKTSQTDDVSHSGDKLAERVTRSRCNPAVAPLSPQEEASKAGRDDRSSVLADRRMDPSAAASSNNNKVKVMATQLLAKFEENAPAQTGLKRQVGRSGSSRNTAGGRLAGIFPRENE